MVRGELAFEGKVGAEVDVGQAGDAAAICAINILAQVKAAIQDLDKVRRVVRLGGFVNCIDTFEDQPGVINRASDLMVEVFGEKGRHARSAVGVNALPLGAPVEIDAMRSEEHTSELQSLMRNSYAVFCLKKKIYKNRHI